MERILRAVLPLGCILVRTCSAKCTFVKNTFLKKALFTIFVEYTGAGVINMTIAIIIVANNSCYLYVPGCVEHS